MGINSFNSKDEATAAAGKFLNRLLSDNKNRRVLLMLSAGSAFSLLDFISPSVLGENLTLSMLDERFSQKPDVNNFLQLQKLDFYHLAQRANANFIGTLPRPRENMDDLRARWEIALENWLAGDKNGKIFATVGMGADGHIAGIFPHFDDAGFFEKTFENQQLLSAYKARGKHPYENRVTATFRLLKMIDEAVVFICGNDKKPKFDELIAGKSRPCELPAVGVYKTKHFQIFTDIT